MRHFTPEEANAELEHVRPLVEQLVATRQEHAAALERQEELELKIRGNGGGIPPAELAQATAEVDGVARRMARLVDEITSHGAQVKDLDSGLIDFPALRHAETVLLCWWWSVRGREDAVTLALAVVAANAASTALGLLVL